MKKRIFTILFSIAILVFAGALTHCGKSQKPDAAAAGHEADAHAHAPGEADHSHEGEAEHADTAGHRHLVVKPEIIKQWGIEYTEAAERDYVEKVSLTGVVRTSQETTYIVNARVSGLVSAIKKDIGQTVKKGDVLCVLNSHDLLDHKNNYIKAFQEFRLSKENYQRAKKLFDIKAIERKEFAGRESVYKTAMADFYSLDAELQTICYHKKELQNVREAVTGDNDDFLKRFLSPSYEILAPNSGKVLMRNLNLGEMIEPHRAIFEVSDTRKMWVILDALEKDLPYISKDKPVQVETDVYPGEAFEGRVLTLMEKIDPELRTVKVRVEVDNADGRLKPEMYVRGLIEKISQRKLPAVPVTALVKLSGVDGVFVIEEGEFLFKAVKVVETDSAGYAFVEGLKPGDMVISKGAFYLKAEYEIQRGGSGAGHGHDH